VRLGARACSSCGRIALEWAAACSDCGSRELEPGELSGEGEVYSATAVRVPPAALVGAAPYVVVMVRLDEGILVLGRWQGEETPGIGARVSATEQDDSATWFAPAS
jgi:uncharacterized OB-fold protein